MKRVGDFIRIVVFSPEILLAFIIFAAYFFLSDWLRLFGERLRSNPDIWKGLYSLPFIFTGFVFKVSGKLRAPLGRDENKKLYEWPLYYKIIDRIVFSTLLCIGCCVGIIIVWIASKKLDNSLMGGLSLLFLGMPGISAFTLILAEHKIKEILTMFA